MTASTTRASSCVPATLRSSAHASCGERAGRYGRLVMIAS